MKTYKKRQENIFTSFLEHLGVKYTFQYAKTVFEEHPYKYSLFGLSKMLSHYNIESVAIRIKDKEENLTALETPFVAHVGGDFVTVFEILQDSVKYIWRGKEIFVPITDFLPAWSGVVLLAEPNGNSVEPGYKEHKKKDFFATLKHILLILACILLLGLITYHTKLFHETGFIVLLLLNLTGFYISYLLVLKQMHIHSDHADKICSLLIDQSDCNNILESDAAKFWGFAWSEIGLGYFISNIIMIVCFPSLYFYVALVNICALPYTLWSVWYQKFKAKQWCPLCLIVQGTLWILFIANLVFGLISMPDCSVFGILLTGCIYMVPILLLNVFIPVFVGNREKEKTEQRFNSLKANEFVFNTLLERSPKYEISRSDSAILFGNKDAENLITVVTNPHCNPCAQMHKKLEELLKETNNGYCIQYILTSFNEELEFSSKLFIAMYQQMNIPDFITFLSKWYSEGRNNPNSFYKIYLFDQEDERMTAELKKQKMWLEKAKVKATPTVFINGYKLPDEYGVEEIKYFSNMEI